MAAVFAVDQLSKNAVDGALMPGERRHLMGGVDLIDVHNHEFVLGMIPVGSGPRMVMGVIGLAIVFALFGASLRRSESSQPLWLPIGLMLGGGLGNIFDLLSKGSATDFIHLSASSVVFNLADAAVLFGMLCMVLLQMLNRPLAGSPGGQALG